MRTSSCGRSSAPGSAATWLTTARQWPSMPSCGRRWRSSCPSGSRLSKAHPPCGVRTWIASVGRSGRRVRRFVAATAGLWRSETRCSGGSASGIARLRLARRLGPGARGRGRRADRDSPPSRRPAGGGVRRPLPPISAVAGGRASLRARARRRRCGGAGGGAARAARIGPGPRLHDPRSSSRRAVRSSSAAGPLRRYGSQGEQRTALLALLFAERRALLDARRRAAADAPRRRDERARRRAARAACEAAGRGRRAGARDRDGARPASPAACERTRWRLRAGEPLAAPKGRGLETASPLAA